MDKQKGTRSEYLAGQAPKPLAAQIKKTTKRKFKDNNPKIIAIHQNFSGSLKSGDFEIMAIIVGNCLENYVEI